MQSDKLHLVYTDDDADDRFLFRSALNELDDSLELTIADDGDDLLQLLRKGPRQPLIIFLDLNMPRRNGYEVLKTIREDEQLRNHKVIIFSTSTDAAAVQKTKELGADLFVAKPRSYPDMKTAIKTCIAIDWTAFRSGGNGYFMHFG